MKNVQIPYELFEALVQYHIAGKDYYEEEIQYGLYRKLDAILMRLYYTEYKTAPAEDDREQARQEYLDKRGVPDSFRWTTPPWKL